MKWLITAALVVSIAAPGVHAAQRQKQPDESRAQPTEVDKCKRPKPRENWMSKTAAWVREKLADQPAQGQKEKVNRK